MSHAAGRHAPDPVPRTRRRSSLIAPLGLAALLCPVAATAQIPTLDRVDSLVTAGAYQPARSTLDRWWSARDEFEVPGSDRARALMLRARLARDPADAEPDYLAVVLGYPTSDHAPEALLRLGQGLLATGDPARAVGYMQRLSDYPGRPDRGRGLLWLARAANSARQPRLACRAARDGLAHERDPALTAMLRIEAAASCRIGGEAARDETADAGRWTVQVGAFRYTRSAESLAERLRLTGHTARIVRVPRNDLLRVRVGRFATADAASRLVTRLRDQGFDALVVGDADQESTR